MRRIVPILTVAALLGLAACQPASVVTTDPGVAPPATVAELPAGGQLDIRPTLSAGTRLTVQTTENVALR